MAIIHSMNVKRFKSFGDLTKGYFKVLLACFHSFDCVVDVFDRYDVEKRLASVRLGKPKLFYSNFLSYICKGQGSFEDNLWVYMGFNNFPRPTFKVTTLYEDAF
jgi:hypothetical protein